jgi:DEAD/DEAH box helicase
MLKTHVKTKNKFQKKKTGKFNKNKPKDGKPKVSRTEQEDEEIKKLQESYEKLPEPKDLKSFDNLPLSKKTRKGLLLNKFRVPTEIQKQSIGLALQGKDVLGAAQTGSGKTLGKDECHSVFEINRNMFLVFSFSHPDLGESVPQKMDTHGRCRSNYHFAHKRAGLSDF